jgi:hypothetical protein
MDGKQIDRNSLNGISKLNVIYVFSQPCTPCNKNIIIWKRISSVMKDKINTFGIIPKELSDEIITFSNNLQLPFRLYCPMNVSQFKEEFRIRSDELAQTIITDGTNVIYSFLGTLDTNEYFRIFKIINNWR